VQLAAEILLVVQTISRDVRRALGLDNRLSPKHREIDANLQTEPQVFLTLPSWISLQLSVCNMVDVLGMSKKRFGQRAK
jgi:hypothetical protein